MPDTVEIQSEPGLKWYARREPVILLVLSTLAALCFLGVSGLSRAFHARQESFARKLFQRATNDRQSGKLDQAVQEYRAALLYSRDNFTYELGLAQALAALNGPDRALNGSDKAYPYLLSLRDLQPDNGTVNLELARSLARHGEADQAIRFYQNAIYSVWPADSENERRGVRLELVEFLLKEHATTQAQAELIAAASNLPADLSEHLRIANLFMEAQDYEHAQSQYQEAARLDRNNAQALAGAGQAAFKLGRYASARDFLHDAIQVNPNDSASAELLKTTSLVLTLDPFRRQLSVRRRREAVVEALAAAGDRLKTCAPAEKPAPAAGEPAAPSLQSQWQEIKSRVNRMELQRNPDLVDEAMNLVFAIEQKASDSEHTARPECGPPAGKDLALLLISKLHEGMEK